MMSLAAGGFVVLSANTSDESSSAQELFELQNAAEAGIIMAVRWLQEHPINAGDPGTLHNWDDTLIITDKIGDFNEMCGKQVKVTILSTPSSTVQDYILKSYSTVGDVGPAYEMEWKVNSLFDGTAPNKSNANLGDLNEKYYPATP
jgi:hypothetical protein